MELRLSKFELISQALKSIFKNYRLILALPLVLAVALFVPSHVVPTAHGQFTGLVCVTALVNATGCVSGPPTIGPVPVGINFTVGVFVQGSDAMGGFDVYVRSNPSDLVPVSASLGTLIVSPSLTSICVNGAAQAGSCTVGTANGPGVIEVTTIEGSGANECGSISPCSGMAFTIIYHVVGTFTSSSLSYPTAAGCSTSSVSSPVDVCVLVADNTGSPLPENIQSATIIQAAPVKDPTALGLACAVPFTVGQTTTCTATVTDTAVTGPTSPTGTVQFLTSGLGSFSPNPCSLSAVAGVSATCPVNFTPLIVGTVSLAAIYSGDATHNSSNTTFSVTINKATPALTTGVSSTTIAVGGTVLDQATLTGGFPAIGVSGTVTYNLYPNSACTNGTSIGFTIVTVGSGNSVPPSGTFTLATAGSYGFNAVYGGDNSNNAVTSSCEPFTVSAAPSFTSGKLHWTHHLSLSKSNNAQTWTADVKNPLPNLVSVVVRIVGASVQNPAITFDVTCGAFACVNTNGNVNRAAISAGRVYVGPGATISFSSSQVLNNGFANNKFTFTATLYWSTGTTYTTSSTKSGAFAVVG